MALPFATLAIDACAEPLATPTTPSAPSKALPETTRADAVTPVLPRRRAPLWEQSVVTAPCTFRGSVRLLRTPIYATSTSKEPFVIVHGRWWRFDLEKLELPSGGAPRYAVTFEDPAHVAGFLDADVALVALPERVEVVPGHAWLPAGAPAAAAWTGDDRARLTATLPTLSSALPQTPEAEFGVELPVTNWSAIVACSELRLAGDFVYWESKARSAADNQDLRSVSAGVVELFESPSAPKPFGRVRAMTTVAFVESKLGRAHVTYRDSEVELDAWVRESELTGRAPLGRIVGGVLARKAPTWHAPEGTMLDVRLRPDARAPVAMTLPSDTSVEGMKSFGPFMAVTIDGFEPPTGQAFYVESARVIPARSF